MAIITRVRYDAQGINSPVANPTQQEDVIAFMKNQYTELNASGDFTVQDGTLVCTVREGSKA